MRSTRLSGQMLLIGSKSARQGAGSFVHSKCTQAPDHMTWFSKLIPPPKHKKKNHSTEGMMNESKENKRAPGLTRRSGTQIWRENRDCDSCCWHFYTLIIILVEPKVHHKTTGCHTERIPSSTIPLTDHNDLGAPPAPAVIFFLNVKVNHVKRKTKHI